MSRRDPAEEALRLFDRLAELPAGERETFLDEHAPRGKEPTLRAKLEQMLERFESATEGLGNLPDLDAVGTVPASIGRYRVASVLGSGGMGVVYLAEQDKPSRRVAVKVLHGGAVDPDRVRRFELEGELLGRLQHPGIAQIFEAGVDGEGPGAHMFLAMEFVDGLPITDYADENGLDQESRVRLLIDVAQAVHHAHARGVVHRDLKPTNILVTRDGQVKVIDFGVARATDREAGATQQTRTGEIVGTLTYMAPEQIRGEVDEIDTRADVYALGVLAYRLLSGRMPLDLAGKPITQVARLVCEVDPQPLGKVEPSCRGDLEWVVARALEKESERRYGSASAFASDLARHLSHEPVEARPASAIYQLRKIARRHRAVVGGVTATFLAVLIGSVIAVTFAVQKAKLARIADERADENADLAQVADERAERNAELARIANERAEDLSRVANFASERLEDVDPRDMGAALRDALLDQLLEDLERRRVPPEDLERDLVALEDLLDQVNHTNVALATLQEAVFEPTRKEIDRQFGGDDRPDLHVKMLVAHGRLLMMKSLWLEAEATLRDAVRVAEALPPESPERLRSSLLLVTVLVQMGRFPEAHEVSEPSLAEARLHLSADDPIVVDALGDSARIASARGDVATAEAIYHEQLEILEPAIQQDPRTLWDALVTMNNLSTLLTSARRPQDADEVVLRAEALMEASEGLDPRIPILVLGMRAVCDSSLGRLETAEATYREVLPMAREHYGDDNAQTVGLVRALAILHQNQGKLADSVPLVREVLEFNLRQFGPEHPATHESRVMLAFALHATGADGEAEPIAASALEFARKAFGPSHPQTDYVQKLHGSIRERLKKGP